MPDSFDDSTAEACVPKGTQKVGAHAAAGRVWKGGGHLAKSLVKRLIQFYWFVELVGPKKVFIDEFQSKPVPREIIGFDYIWEYMIYHQIIWESYLQGGAP